MLSKLCDLIYCYGVSQSSLMLFLASIAEIVFFSKVKNKTPSPDKVLCSLSEFMYLPMF